MGCTHTLSVFARERLWPGAAAACARRSRQAPDGVPRDSLQHALSALSCPSTCPPWRLTSRVVRAQLIASLYSFGPVDFKGERLDGGGSGSAQSDRQDSCLHALPATVAPVHCRVLCKMLYQSSIRVSRGATPRSSCCELACAHEPQDEGGRVRRPHTTSRVPCPPRLCSSLAQNPLRRSAMPTPVHALARFPSSSRPPQLTPRHLHRQPDALRLA